MKFEEPSKLSKNYQYLVVLLTGVSCNLTMDPFMTLLKILPNTLMHFGHMFFFSFKGKIVTNNHFCFYGTFTTFTEKAGFIYSDTD